MSDHSVAPDKITGWQQRQIMAKLKQFPLIFMNPCVDLVSKTLTSFGNNQIYRVVYMGPRHNSNMKAFKNYCRTETSPQVSESLAYGVKQLYKFQFKHLYEHEKFFPIRISQYRLFTGMNPTFKKDDLRFDSDFQCGNLDLAVYINPAEYDLVMRVDSNTKGHTTWFYFKVSNAAPNQKIKFNVINFGKKYLLYKDGMRPYVYKKSTGQWVQSCISVTYHGRKFRYEGVEDTHYQCLSFIYQFKDTQQVYFAYCVPYSYSYLLHRLQQLRSKAPHLMKISYDSESTGGLPIPVVTISNFSSGADKINVLCTARLHPGQTQGSWMIDGFMQQLLTPQSHYLRERVMFKIVPMINVDGVVLGNFRTGIMGRDLNRCFNLYDRYNQITVIHRLAQETNPLMYLDFHGHSAKKNVFIYGPDYRLEDRNYLLSRVFPKLISKQTEAFRYYSCSFIISKSKGTTGRAVMMRNFKVQFSFTIEASSHGYGPVKNYVNFTGFQYYNVGSKIAVSLTEFVKILKILPKRQQIKQKKQAQKAQQSNTISKQKAESTTEENNEGSSSKSNLIDFDSLACFSIIQKNLFRQIMKDQPTLDQEAKQAGSEQSDFEDETNDYSNSDINKILDAKFDPKQKKQRELEKSSSKQKKRKKKEKSKQRQRQKQSAISSKKSVQLSRKKRRNFLQKNKSYSNKSIENQKNILSNSQTIDIMESMKVSGKESLQKSKILQSNPNFMEGIISTKDRHRNQLNTIVSASSMLGRSNNVHYDWGGYKKQHRISSKHFEFEIPQYFEPVVAKKKQQQKTIESEKKVEKKNPMFSIKKSILPMLKISSDGLVRQGPERSMLSEILQQHQKKKKAQRNVRIMFL